VSDERGLLDRIKARGEEAFTQVSGQLMANPAFVKAMETAFRGKEKLDTAAGRALKQMNIPTRGEFKKALSRIEALEREIAALKQKPRRAARSPRGPAGQGPRQA
jgi:polyhydroxyalkanoate synthesis regulator phasin